jgi:hypothetical protein
MLKHTLRWRQAVVTGTRGVALRWGFGLLCLSLAASAGAADYEPGTPSVYLFDTGMAAAGPIAPAKLDPKAGWTLVPEDNLTHAFRGDAVVLNDRLSIALRRQGTRAEVYGHTPTGPQPRVALVPLAASAGEPTVLVSLKIIENNPGAVVLAATYRAADGGTCAMQVRLTAGQMIAEARLGEGAASLAVRGPMRHVIVPDFFAEDMVFQAATARPRVRLPAENFLLGLLGEGAAQVMCVWRSGPYAATAVSSPARGQAAFEGCEIKTAPDTPIWVAVLEGSGLWHESAIDTGRPAGPLTIDWKPPFAAKWRADLLGPRPAARSWFVHMPDAEDDATPAAEGPPACCLEGDRIVLRLPAPGQTPVETPPAGAQSPAKLLVYALDRSRATPLTTFCPIDVLRNTLGVGPCQYVLQSEGLASATNPTPENVMAFVEKQFARRREAKTADEIGQMLDLMVEQVRRGQQRIAEYARAGREVRAMCAAADGAARADAETLDRIAADLEQAAAAPTGDAPQEQAARLAAAIKALIGQNDAAARCEQIGIEVRQLGGVQARALARCRMAARWLRQSSATVADEQGPASDLARRVMAWAEGVMQTQ